MTALIARPPLQVLSMSTVQSTSRRHSARLQQKEDLEPTNWAHDSVNRNTKGTTQRPQAPPAVAKKRKNAYDEEDDGFVFSRVKRKKPRQSVNDQPEPSSELPIVQEQDNALPEVGRQEVQPGIESIVNNEDEKSEPPQKKRRARMSFSTPAAKDHKPVRRSKRLSTDVQETQGSPSAKAPQDIRPAKVRQEKVEKHKPPAQSKELELKDKQATSVVPVPTVPSEETHSSTKIALPFADTPVISRNKAMREGKSGKGERRSSLGLRGRRASSLIDSGTSNALPHTEVDGQEFYKHIESDLMEPRRMRQLLTWCATRAMHPKPQGMNFEEASAMSAARVIEEEVLKDLANKSELSDWFSREDAPVPAIPLPERPNPKNVLNAEKIAELEEQVKRLRQEKTALESLLRPPSVSKLASSSPGATTTQETALLSEGDKSILQVLTSAAKSNIDEVAKRLHRVISDVEPAVDTFADGIHKINQYRIGADSIASKVLATCANKLAEREKAGRSKALGQEHDRSPGRDLSQVLRGLSRADR